VSTVVEKLQLKIHVQPIIDLIYFKTLIIEPGIIAKLSMRQLSILNGLAKRVVTL